MKHSLSTVLIVGHLLITGISVDAREVVFGLSPFQESAAAKQQIKSVIGFMVETLEPGDHARLFDAYTVKSIGEFVVPNKAVYANPKAKLGANRKVAAALLRFADRSRAPMGENTPSVVGAIRLPQFLAFLGHNYPVSDETAVMILGNPLYDDPKEPRFSMANGHLPGDGHLQHSRSDTPFGVKGQSGLLTHYRVHFGYTDEQQWKRNDNHSFHVKRWWSLYISEQGGSLGSFTGDVRTLFHRVRSNAAAPIQTFVVTPTDRLEMILLRPPVVGQEMSIYQRPLSTMPISPDAINAASHLEISISWDCLPCDLDLYARPGLGKHTLSFSQTQSPEGTYFKDFTTSPRASHGFETVVFHRPVDVHELLLAVNFYGGEGDGPVTGELRIAMDDHTYAQRFEIAATHGNHGRGSEPTLRVGKAATPHWLIIDPLEVVGLNVKP